MSSRLGEVFVEVRGDAEPLVSDITSALDQAEQEAAGFGNRFESAMTGPVARGAAVAGGAAAVAIGAGLRSAVDLDGQLREVVTLFGETGAQAEASVTGLQAPVRDLATTIGVAQSELTDGLYNAISAGVPRENAFAFLETAGRFAIGGVTDTATAVDGLTTAINAFGLDSSDADEVADAFFAAVQGGKTNAEELSSSLFQVAPAANAAGLGLDETLAGVAALTASGVPTAVATTQMRGAINELADPASNVGAIFSELTGTTFRDFIAAGGSLEEALEIVGDAAVDSGDQIGDLFGSVEAAAAATLLYNDDSGAFAANLELQANAAGAAAGAYELVADGAGQQLEVLKQQGAALLSELGQTFLPIFTTIASTLVRVAGGFSSLPDPVRRFLAVAVGVVAVLGPLPLILGKMMPLFRSFGTVVRLGATAFRLLNVAMLANPVGLIVAAVAALVAAFIWAWNNIDGFREFFVNLWERIKEAAAAVVDWFTGTLLPALTAVWNTVRDVAVAAWEMIQNAVGTVVDWFRDHVGPIIDAAGELISAIFGRVGGAGEGMGATIRAVWDAIVSAAQTAWEFIQAVWDVVGEPLLAVIGAQFEVMRAVVGAVWEAVKTIVETAMAIIAEVIAIVTAAISGDWSAVWEGIQNIAATVWDAITSLIDTAINLIRSVIDTVLGVIRSLWDTAWNGLVTFVTGAWDRVVSAVTGGIDDVMGWIRGIPDRITYAVRNFGTLLRDAGRSLLDGLIGGIRDRIDGIRTAIGDAASAVTQFWPFSPAKAGPLRSHPPEQAGANVINLLAAGMRGSLGAIAAEAEAAALAAIPPDPGPFSAAEVTPINRRPSAATPAMVEDAVRRDPGGGSSMTVNQTIYTADPRRAAGESLRRLRDVTYLSGPFDPPSRGVPIREDERVGA